MTTSTHLRIAIPVYDELGYVHAKEAVHTAAAAYHGMGRAIAHSETKGATDDTKLIYNTEAYGAMHHVQR